MAIDSAQALATVQSINTVLATVDSATTASLIDPTTGLAITTII